MQHREETNEMLDDGFFTRWSRRKSDVMRGDEPADEPVPESPADDATTPSDSAETEEVRIDPRTGKAYDELTDADMPPLESLTQDSDVSMFLARNISPELRRQALRTLFRGPKFNKVCLCAEYAGDYTTWQPLGDVVPHDWKRAIVREAERAKKKLAEAMEDSGESSPVRDAAPGSTSDGTVAATDANHSATTAAASAEPPKETDV